MHRHRLLPGLVLEMPVHRLDHPLLVLIAHRIQKQRPALVAVDGGAQPPAAGGQRQAQRVAAAVAGGHEDGGGFPPDQQLVGVRRGVAVQGVAGHQQAGGPAGEFGGLAHPGNIQPRRVLRLVVQPLLEAQGVLVVLVVIRGFREQLVAQTLVKADRRRVVPAHFQAQIEAFFPVGVALGGVHQLLAKPLAATGRVGGDGIETRHARAALQNHQCVAGQGALGACFVAQAMGHDQPGMGLADPMAEAAA